MKVSAFCRMAVCAFLLIPELLPAADDASAMLYVHGAASINGAAVPRTSAIFSGDILETGPNGAARIQGPGVSITVPADTRMTFNGSALDLQHGALAILTSKNLTAIAENVRITPYSRVWTEFSLSQTKAVLRIVAVKGDLVIVEGNEVSTLPEGREITRSSPSSESAGNGPQDNKKKRKKAAAAPAAAIGGILNYQVAGIAGTAAIAGLAIWLFWPGDDPISPYKP